MTTRVRRGEARLRHDDALREVMPEACVPHDRLIKDGYTHVVDADLQSYFDTIPHDRLMARIEDKVVDGVVPKARFQRDVLDLIRGWLRADILKGLERWTPTQGSPRHGAAVLRTDVR